MKKATQPVEIADICAVLERLGQAEILPPASSNACLRGAYLLKTFRETVLTGRNDAAVVARLKEVLASNQEG